MIKTNEDHDNLRIVLTNVRQTVNELISAGFMEITGKRKNLKFYLGGDYKVSVIYIVLTFIHNTEDDLWWIKKTNNCTNGNYNTCQWKKKILILKFHFIQFLLLAMGMKAAISNNSCIWCLIHKKDRYIMCL